MPKTTKSKTAVKTTAVKQKSSKVKSQNAKTAKRTVSAQVHRAPALKQSPFWSKDAPHTVQDTIPYIAMYDDGICEVETGYYTKTVAFDDINYQILPEESQEIILNQWCELLSSFDENVTVQFSYMNHYVDLHEFDKYTKVILRGDNIDPSRIEISRMLKAQAAKGNNGLTRSKFATFGVRSDSMGQARKVLSNIEFELVTNFKSFGVRAWGLGGIERLQALHRQMNPDPKEKCLLKTFNGNNGKPRKNIPTKNYIAPDSLDFRDMKMFQMGDKFASVSFLHVTANVLEDEILKKVLDLPQEMTITFHVQAINQEKAIKLATNVLSDLEKSKIDQQMKAVQAGYDMDITSAKQNKDIDDTKDTVDSLTKRDEHYFDVSIMIMHIASTRAKLKTDFDNIKSAFQQKNCALKPLTAQQEQGFTSSLILGKNDVQISKGLTTSALAVFVPFMTADLCQDGEDAFYYGVNPLSGNFLRISRKLLKNPNGLIFGTPGSGKTFAAKMEMAMVRIYLPHDHVLIIDPEGEYGLFTKNFGGEVIKLSHNSKSFINPLDIHMNYGDGEDPISLKSTFILSFCQLIMSSAHRGGLSATEQSVLDRCVRKIYMEYFKNPIPERMPILEDLYDALLAQNNADATNIASALEMYVHGSHNMFNKRTNINTKNRMICFDTKELGATLKELGMLILNDQIWLRVSANRVVKKSTWLYVDEFHLLLKNKITSDYFVDIWKRFRKWGGIPTGITQNVTDVTSGDDAKNILKNSDFVLMFNQSKDDQDVLATTLRLSAEHLTYVTNSPPGTGLAYYDGIVLPFVNDFDKRTELYKYMTSKPTEMILS